MMDKPERAIVALKTGTDDRSRRQLRIMLTLLHPGYVRNYEDVLRSLLERGHRVHVAVLMRAKQSQDRVAERLGEEFGNLTVGLARKSERNGWRNVRWVVRAAADYARYLHPRYADAAELRARVAEKLRGSRRDLGPLLALTITAFVGLAGRFRGARYSDCLVRTCLRIERALPSSRIVAATIADFGPDILISSPYVAVGTAEADYVQSAREMGVPTAVFVASWDNLTNKGLFKTVPDRVFLWNEAQKKEAIELHRIPEEHIVVTGAQRFDAWFDQQPTSRREDFVELVGLDASRPFLLYLCSSMFIAPNEVAFVEHLLMLIRSNDSPIRDVGILVRPHPQNAKQWLDIDLTRFGNATVWPPSGAQPVDAHSRAEYFDSIYHSAAVLGINTSAQIEAGIIGRTVHTVRTPEFAHAHSGTLHFQHLLGEANGLVQMATSLEELIENLRLALEGRLDDGRVSEFVASFVRPHGREVSATSLFVEAVEAIPSVPVAGPWSRGAGDRLIQLLLTPVAYCARSISWPGIKKHLSKIDIRADRKSVSDPASDPDRKAERSVRRGLTTLKKDRQTTIVAGPWLYGRSHELLYWIPFLRWATQAYHLEPSRLVAVSSGGVQSWYQRFADRYVDLLDVIPDSDDEGGPSERSLFGPSAYPTGESWEQIVAQRLRDESNDHVTFLTPELAQHTFGRVQAGLAPMRHYERFTDVRRLRPLPNPALELLLPESFVAVQFEFAPWFPDTRNNREAMTRVLDQLRGQLPLVLLNPHAADESVRSVVRESSSAGAFLLEDADPAHAVGADAFVLSQSRGFMGSYGSACQIAVAHGVPCVGVYSAGLELNAMDVDLTGRMGRFTGSCFSLTSVASLESIGTLFVSGGASRSWAAPAPPVGRAATS